MRIKLLNGTTREIDIFDEVAVAAEFGADFLPFLREAQKANPEPETTEGRWTTAALCAYRGAKDAQRQHDCTESPLDCVCDWCTQVLGHWGAVDELWTRVLALPEVEAAREHERVRQQQNWEEKLYTDAAVRATRALGAKYLPSRGHYAVVNYHRQEPCPGPSWGY